jgi:phosphoribosyl 1,2-cyclic phosphodiesterase
MKVRFWGTRGSLPVALTASKIRGKLIAALHGATGLDLTDREAVAAYVDHRLGFDVAGTFGGHTSCVQIETDASPSEHVVLDLGSGARPLAEHFINLYGTTGQTYHVFLSHVHWDHIMGFPFFTPAYIPGNRIVIHSGHADAEFALRRQQKVPSFPVDFGLLGATIEFQHHRPEEVYDVAGLKVRNILQKHSGDSYGWRFERAGKTIVYSTDAEHQVGNLPMLKRFTDFFRSADLVIFDAMYSLADAVSVRADWGHSSNIIGVELCQSAGARRLCLFHHEPASDDTQLTKVLEDTRTFEKITRGERALEVISAYDGLELSL